MSARDERRLSIESRLTDAALAGETVEVILVLRGTVSPTGTPGRWRIRGAGQRARIFDADAVLAATAATAAGRSRRRRPA